MNDDEPRAEVRELASKLFAAARAERPGPALGRRLSLIQPRVGGGLLPMTTAPGSGERPQPSLRKRSSWAVGFAAIALVAGGVGFFATSQREAAIEMSAERGLGRHARGNVASEAVDVTAAPRAAAEGGVAREPVAPDATGSTEMPASSAARVRERDQRAPERAAARPSEGHRPGKLSAPARSSSGNSGNSGAGGVEASSSPAAEAIPSAPLAAASASTGDAPSITLRDELALVKDARVALRSGDAQRALELLDRHAAATQGSGGDRGGLLAEATVLRIETLAALGRPELASELATRFVRDNPHSALNDRAKSFIQKARRAP